MITQVTIKRTKVLGLECFRVYVRGVFISQTWSLAGAKTCASHYMQKLNKRS